MLEWNPYRVAPGRSLHDIQGDTVFLYDPATLFIEQLLANFHSSRAFISGRAAMQADYIPARDSYTMGAGCGHPDSLLSGPSAILNTPQKHEYITPAPCNGMGPLRPKEVIKTSNYEIMLILNPEAESERQKQILERVKEIAATGKGSVDKVDEWGKKRLAYDIDHIRDGYYYVISLTVIPDVLNEISRILRITDEVIRFMPVRLPERTPKVTSES